MTFAFIVISFISLNIENCYRPHQKNQLEAKPIITNITFNGHILGMPWAGYRLQPAGEDKSLVWRQKKCH